MRSIRREALLDPVVRRLGETQHPAARRSIFPTLRDALSFAALLGYERGEQTPLIGELVELDGRLFANHAPSMDTMYLIGLAQKRDLAILREDHEEELISIFEEYANGGLRVLEGWLNETPEDVDGEYALINALRAHGFLITEADPDSIIGDVEF